MSQTLPFFVTSLDILKIHHTAGRRRVRARDFHCLSFCFYGRIDILTDTEHAVSRAGSVTFIPRGVPFTSVIDEEREIIAVHFNVRGSMPKKVQVLMPSQSIDFEEEFTTLYELYDSVEGERGLICMSMLYRLLSKIYDKDGFRSELSGYDRRILPALDYINKSYQEPNASDVGYLAGLCGFSTAYLRRLFIGEFGLSTSAYVKRFRINKACTLLDSGYYSVTEVSLQCGFNSTSYFAKEFKRCIGITPSEYIAAKPTQ